jgi:hypothetical protein
LGACKPLDHDRRAPAVARISRSPSSDRPPHACMIRSASASAPRGSRLPPRLPGNPASARPSPSRWLRRCGGDRGHESGRFDNPDAHPRKAEPDRENHAPGGVCVRMERSDARPELVDLDARARGRSLARQWPPNEPALALRPPRASIERGRRHPRPAIRGEVVPIRPIELRVKRCPHWADACRLQIAMGEHCCGGRRPTDLTVTPAVFTST